VETSLPQVFVVVEQLVLTQVRPKEHPSIESLTQLRQVYVLLLYYEQTRSSIYVGPLESQS